MTFLCIGRSVVREAKIVSYVDLVIATFAILFGLLSLTWPDSFFTTWDVLSYRVDIPKEISFSGTLITISTIFLLCIFVIEIFLFFIFTGAIKHFAERKLTIWYKCRFVLFILTVLVSIYRTIVMRNEEHDIVICKGILFVILLLYKGYGLLVVTFLEELFINNETINERNTYFKL